MELYAIKSNISGLYWNEKKGTWVLSKFDPDIWHTKEQLDEIQKHYTSITGVQFDEEIIVKKENL